MSEAHPMPMIPAPAAQHPEPPGRAPWWMAAILAAATGAAGAMGGAGGVDARTERLEGEVAQLRRDVGAVAAQVAEIRGMLRTNEGGRP